MDGLALSLYHPIEMERLSKRLLERRDSAQPITILLAVALGIVFIFVLCLL